MSAKKVIAPELLAEAGRLYEQTLAPVTEIMGMLDVSHETFYDIVKREGWRMRRARVARFEFSKAMGAAAAAVVSRREKARAPLTTLRPMAPEQRAAIAARLMAATEEALDAIKRVTAQMKPSNPDEADRNAHSMAHISRALREIATLVQPDEVTSDEADDDPVPRDIDEFRYELARRIRGFIEARSASAAGVPAIAERELE